MERKELINRIKEYNNFQILLAIKKVSDESIIGNISVNDVNDILSTLEMWQLADILTFIN
jgi:hypothetical protein